MKAISFSWHGEIQLVCLLLVWIFNANGQSECSCNNYLGLSSNCETCSDGCFLSNNRCFQCPDNCLTCNSTSLCVNCLPEFYGAICENPCNRCKNGICSKTSCIEGCADGYYQIQGRALCEKCNSICITCDSNSYCTKCSTGFYGSACQYSCRQTCSSCSSNSDCTNCKSGYFGPVCQYSCPRTCSSCSSNLDCTECKSGYYGSACQYSCPQTCSSCSGSSDCTNCKSGYFGPACQYSCPRTCSSCSSNLDCTNCKSGYYGAACRYSCPRTCSSCSRYSDCTNCKSGYFGPACQYSCPQTCSSCSGSSDCTNCKSGYFGPACQYSCPQTCSSCSSSSDCTNCKSGYFGPACQYSCPQTCSSCSSNSYCRECKSGYYGSACQYSCPQTCSSCSRYSYCRECKSGYYGSACQYSCPQTCSSCSSYSYCRECKSGYYGSACRYSCPQTCSSCSSYSDCTECISRYYGSACQYSCPQTCSSCSSYLDCTNCKSGYYGSACQYSCPQTCSSCSSSSVCTECKSGYYGPACQYPCTYCKHNTCNKHTGLCTNGCTDGYYEQVYCIQCPSNCDKCNSGTDCTSCKSKYYGPSCGSKCDTNCLYGFCNSNNGECTNGCREGYYQSDTSCLQNCILDFCQICTSDNQLCSVCNDGYYLFNGICAKCSGGCINKKCNKSDGSCSEGCIDGFTTRYCNDQCYSNCNACEQYDKNTCSSCKPGYHGQNCEYECTKRCEEVDGERSCDKTNGVCTNGCQHGYTGSTCSDECSINCLSCDRHNQRSCDTCNPGYYGQVCDERCSFHCGEANNTRPCNKDTGECLVNCTKGYRGMKCDVPCEAGCHNGCDRDTGACDRCKALYYGPSCEFTCNSTCYNPNNGSNVCDKQTGNCSFECSASQCGVQSGQESATKLDNNGAIIGAATGSVIFVLIVMILVTVFIVMRRKRQKMSNPEPDGMEGNTDAVYSIPEKNRSSKKVESTALYVIPNKSTPVQVNSSTPVIYENGVYSNVEDRPSLPTIETTDATEDGLEEINQDDINKGTLADVEGPKVDNYYNIYGLTRSRIQLNKLNTYVASKTTEGFEKEFKKLPEGLNRPYNDAVGPKNVTKNRYKGIYPYDATRVKLEGNGGDYINASYIEGFGELEKTYIASLGPIKRFMKGYVDFWRMVWQENVDRIIMLTNFVEGTKEKCDKYWPEIGQTKTYGHVVVECINVERFADFNISKLNVSTISNSKTTTIHHFHFTAWPDRGTPSNVVSLVEFRESVERVKSTTKGPTVVHCSAGIGRTGTYIALDILTREGQTEGYVDIFGCVLSLRGQRVGMVQNVDQYRYLHHAIEHSLTTKCEQIENGNFCRVSADQIDEGFNFLKAMKEYKEEEESKAIEKNKKEKLKNRKGADIPGDAGRPKLSNHNKRTESQYINAVYVDSFKQTNKYILAQTPLTATIEDFLGLVLQENCSCIIALDDIEHTRKQDIGMYVPAGDNELTIGKFKVNVTNSESTPEYELRYITINVQGTENYEVKTIPHYQFTDWPANSPVPASVDSFLNLIRDTDRIVRDSGNGKGPVLVHCLTGAERCGLIPVIANLFEKLEAEQQASVVNVTRQIRARRARAIPNKEQFQFSYSCVKQFVENSSVYANVL